MGIRSLQTFADSFPGQVYKDIDLVELVRTAKEGLPEGTRPTIIMDLKHCQRLWNRGLDVVCGGQGREFLERVQLTLEAFDQLGVELVFVQGAATLERRHFRWTEKWGHLKTIMIQVAGGVIPELVHNQERRKDEYHHVQPNCMLSKILKSICKRKVLVAHESLRRMQAIVQFARDPLNHALAIISQDSDFMAVQYPLNVRYVSAKSLDFSHLPSPGEPWIAKEYDREELALCLGLKSTTQFPLFAALRGDPVITGLNKEWPTSEVLLHIGEFVSQGNFSDSSEIPQKQIEQISTKFCDPLVGPIVLDTVRAYFYIETNPVREKETKSDDDDWSIILNIFHKTEISNLLETEMITKSPFLQCFDDPDLPAGKTAFKKLRQRAYEVLFFSKPGAFDTSSNQFNTMIKEIFFDGSKAHDPLDKIIEYQSLEPPPDYHPGLRRLLQERSEEIKDISWKLITNILCPGASASDLRQVPKEFLCPVCQLLALQNFDFPILYGWEVNLFLVIHQKLLKMAVSDELAIGLETKKLSPRGIHLAALYTDDFFANISEVFPATEVEFSYLCPFLNFNGLLFQSKYQQYVETRSFDGMCSAQELDGVKVYYDLITFGGRRVRENYEPAAN